MEVVYVRIVFSTILPFRKSRNRKCALFVLLRNTIIHLLQNSPSKLWQNEKKCCEILFRIFDSDCKARNKAGNKNQGSYM